MNQDMGIGAATGTELRGQKRHRSDEYYCPSCARSFARYFTYKRHQTTKGHRENTNQHPILFPCEHEDCERSFSREDDRHRHIREVHEGIKRTYNIAGTESGTSKSNNDDDDEHFRGLGHDQHEEHESLDTFMTGLHDNDIDMDGQTGEHGVELFPGVFVEGEDSLLWDVSIDAGLGHGLDIADEQTFVESAKPPSESGVSARSLPLPHRGPECIGHRLKSSGLTKTRWACKQHAKCTLCTHTHRDHHNDDEQKHAACHIQQLADNSYHSQCIECNIGFKHEKDYTYHMNVARRLGHCGFDFPHSQCTGHHPPNKQSGMRTDHDNMETTLRSWELSQLTNHLKQITDHLEGSSESRVPDEKSTAVSARLTLSKLSSRMSRFARASLFTKISAPTCIDCTWDHHGGSLSRNVFAHPLSVWQKGVDYVSKIGSLRYKEPRNRKFEDHIVQALRNCDSKQLKALLADDHSVRVAQEEDPSNKMKWSVFDLLDKCEEDEHWPGGGFMFVKLFECVDILVNDGRTSRQEAAELAAGNHYETFVRYLISGVDLNLGSILIEDVFCKAIFLQDQETVARLLAKGAGVILLNAAQLECFFTGKPGHFQFNRDYQFVSDNHNTIASKLITSSGNLARLLRGVDSNPCADAVACEVKKTCCRKCAERYRRDHHSWQSYRTDGHSHRVRMCSRTCYIDQLKLELARCFLPRVARTVLEGF